MRLHTQEFKLDEEIHEELCKREHSAMIIKRAKPDPVEFKSTVQPWISNIFKEYETFDNTLAAPLLAEPQEIREYMENPENWQEALTDETLKATVIENYDHISQP